SVKTRGDSDTTPPAVRCGRAIGTRPTRTRNDWILTMGATCSADMDQFLERFWPPLGCRPMRPEYRSEHLLKNNIPRVRRGIRAGATDGREQVVAVRFDDGRPVSVRHDNLLVHLYAPADNRPLPP